MKSIKILLWCIERETIVKHDIPKNYKCKYCSEFFASPQGLGSHLHNKHSTVETKQFTNKPGFIKQVVGRMLSKLTIA
jgi:hypothetical protein